MIINKPPMGWNSWNTFAEGVNEKVVRETAEAMVSTGLKDAGYNYVVIDDCWSLRERDKDGKMVADPDKFPSGMKKLAEYIHSLGMKFGMYSSAGLRTCADYPGSYGREFIDAETFASWDVDYLKYDLCFFPQKSLNPLCYNKMGLALKATGRDILYAVCNHGDNEVEKWVRSTGAHIYRSTGDIGERFYVTRNIALSQKTKWRYAAPGCYNDMDMLTVGMDGIGFVGHPGICGDIEYKTHFALWCMANSPLMIGSDVRRLRPETIELLKNPGLLRINADEECRPPVIQTIPYNSNIVTMFKHMSNHEFALGFFNLTEDDASPDLRPWDMGLPRTAGIGLKIKEVFTGEEHDYIDDYFSVKLAPHDCKIFIGSYVTKD